MNSRSFVIFNKAAGYVAKQGFTWDATRAVVWPYRAACRVAQSVARRLRGVAQLQSVEQAKRPLPCPDNWRLIELANGRNPSTGRGRYGLTISHEHTLEGPWHEIRDQQNAATAAQADEIDTLIARCVETGLLVLNEPSGRQYSY